MNIFMNKRVIAALFVACAIAGVQSLQAMRPKEQKFVIEQDKFFEQTAQFLVSLVEKSGGDKASFRLLIEEFLKKLLDAQQSRIVNEVLKEFGGKKGLDEIQNRIDKSAMEAKKTGGDMRIPEKEQKIINIIEAKFEAFCPELPSEVEARRNKLAELSARLFQQGPKPDITKSKFPAVPVKTGTMTAPVRPTPKPGSVKVEVKKPVGPFLPKVTAPVKQK